MSNFISLILSIVSLLIAGLVAVITYRYNKINIRNEARLEHNKLLLKIDRMYIDDPDLWSIHDDHPISRFVEKTPLKSGKKEAFIYYYFNFFDIIYGFYHKQIFMNKNDRNDWQSWSNFIKDFLSGCSEARDMFRDSSSWYDRDFSHFMMTTIREIEDEIFKTEVRPREEESHDI